MKEWSDLHEISYLEGPRNSDLYFKFITNPVSLGGGTGNLGKHLKQRDQNET